jgi:SEC-C motif-containing protein
MDVDSDSRCPCGTGLTYGECCEPFHRAKAQPPTAERMMRSRYSAYVLGNAAYLLATWHASTRPTTVTFDPDLTWLRLDILGRTRGGMLDSEGTVEFCAHYRSEGVRQDQHENSRFVRVNKTWLYLDDIQ